MFLASDEFGNDRYESVDGEVFFNVFDNATRDQLISRGYNIWTWNPKTNDWTI
jgi:hypothetical protein